MAETRELQEKLNGQVALNEAVEDQLELCGTRLRDWGRRQKRADAKLEKAEEKHTEHLRLRGEWADEVKLLRDGKAQAETELQESRTREAALRQALVEATAAWEEQAGDAAALKAQQAALRQELTEVEERYFGLAMELKNQDADIRRTKRACLGRFRDLPVGGGDDRLPGLPRTPTEANLTRSEVAADEYATPLGTAGTTGTAKPSAPASLLASFSEGEVQGTVARAEGPGDLVDEVLAAGANTPEGGGDAPPEPRASPVHAAEEGGGEAQTATPGGGIGCAGSADAVGGTGGSGGSDAGPGAPALAEAMAAEPLQGCLSIPAAEPPQDPSEQGAQRTSNPGED